ncbi:MAG: Lrp/AsnC family transcriptional regulator [Pseudomonadota bacterium]
MAEIDAIDRRIIMALQRDCRQSMAELGEAAGLSASACHRRVRLLEDHGYITGYGARLDRRRLGFQIEFFVEVELNAQSDAALMAFERAVGRVEEILECHLMAGGTDYLLRVVALDVNDFERIHRERLTKLPHVSRVHSNLAMRTVRGWDGYPVPARVPGPVRS